MPEAGAKSHGFAVTLALAAVAIMLLAMLAGLGSRWDWWTFRTGFTMLRWAVYAAILIGVLAIAAIVLARPAGPLRGMPFAIFALLVSAALLGNALHWRRTSGRVPPIHDITTDTQNPPEFVAIAPLRANTPNSVEYAGEAVATQQREAYPDIGPIRLRASAAAAFERALAAATRMGWEVVAADAGAGRIEATDRTFWFGFRDDVVIRLTAAGDETVVDVRSKSRVGRGDVGANARRIRRYAALLSSP